MRKGLGHTAAGHRSLGAARRASARRLYNDAIKNATQKRCIGAITNLTLAASYEGEAHAHAEAVSADEMVKVRKLMALRDKALDKVIKACKV